MGFYFRGWFYSRKTGVSAMIDFRTVKSVTIPEGTVTSIAYADKVLWQKVTETEYVPVEYLESTGTQYINTGIAGNNENLRIELTFEIRAFTQYGGVFGNYVSETANCWRMIQYSSDINRAYITSGSITNKSKLIVLAKNTKHTFAIEAKKYILNGAATSLGNLSSGTENSTNICIFTARAGGTSSKMRLYSFKVYDSGNLVRDFIPALDWNDRPCMYDKVSGELFYNQGTGEFLYGEIE